MSSITSTKMDDVDMRLLEVLGRDARASVAAIATRVGVSRATAYNRIDRLEGSGLIKGYTIRVDASRAGTPVTAIVMLNGGQHSWKPLQQLIAGLPAVQHAFYVTGAADVVLVVRVAGIEQLRDLILHQLQQLPGIRGTQTLMVLDEVVDRPFVLPDSARKPGEPGNG
jgi:Lrp/AsnC family leucine-responsive transcriptional regulator